MNWLDIAQLFAALYLIGFALIIKTDDIQSSLFFKVAPMMLGLPLLIGTIGKVLGWPI